MRSVWNILAEALGIAEATLDIDKYALKYPEKPKYKPGMEPVASMSRADQQAAEKEKTQAASRQEMADAVPLLRNETNAQKIEGKPNWAKIKNWYVNTKHWGKGKQGADGAVDADGGDFIVPKSGPARTFVTRMHYADIDRLGVVFSVETPYWEKHFKKEFGENPMDSYLGKKSESLLRKVFAL